MKKLPKEAERFYQSPFYWEEKSCENFYVYSYARLEDEIWINKNESIKLEFEDLFSATIAKVYETIENGKRDFVLWENVYKYVCTAFLNRFLRENERLKRRTKVYREYAEVMRNANQDLFSGLLLSPSITRIFDYIDKKLADQPYLLSPQERKFFKIYRTVILDPLVIDERATICQLMNISENSYKKLKSNLKSFIIKIIYTSNIIKV